MAQDKNGGKATVNLEEATRLIDALERDLAKLRGDSDDLQHLREEVRGLKRLLASPAPRHHSIRAGLHSLREVFSGVLDTAVADGLKASQYVAEIGRILGL